MQTAALFLPAPDTNKAAAVAATLFIVASLNDYGLPDVGDGLLVSVPALPAGDDPDGVMPDFVLLIALLLVMLLPDDPPFEVAPEPESIAPLAGVEPAAPLVVSVAPPAMPPVAVPAVPVLPVVATSVVVAVVVVVSSAFFPHAPTLSAAAMARILTAVRMGIPSVAGN